MPSLDELNEARSNVAAALSEIEAERARFRDAAAAQDAARAEAKREAERRGKPVPDDALAPAFSSGSGGSARLVHTFTFDQAEAELRAISDRLDAAETVPETVEGIEGAPGDLSGVGPFALPALAEAVMAGFDRDDEGRPVRPSQVKAAERWQAAVADANERAELLLTDARDHVAYTRRQINRFAPQAESEPPKAPAALPKGPWR